jgi:hypothetical protein
MNLILEALAYANTAWMTYVAAVFIFMIIHVLVVLFTARKSKS